MVSDIFESITTYLKERVVSPLSGALALSWFAWNHRIFFVLFSDLSVSAKFYFIDEHLYPNVLDVLGKGMLFPLVSAALYIWLYPIPARIVYGVWLRDHETLARLKLKIEGAKVLTEAQAERLKRRNLEAEVKYRTDMASADERISRLEDLAATQSTALLEKDRELLELRAAVEIPLGGDESTKDFALTTYLLSRPFVLHFNPKSGQKKTVTFASEGRLLDGRNDNENGWAVSAGKLVFLDQNGLTYSTFRFDQSKPAFLMVDDESPRAVKGQFLIPQ